MLPVKIIIPSINPQIADAHAKNPQLKREINNCATAYPVYPR